MPFVTEYGASGNGPQTGCRSNRLRPKDPVPCRKSPRGGQFCLMPHSSPEVGNPAEIVLHLFKFFAARDDFGGARVRRTKENSPARQRWEGVKDTGSPGTGRKSFYSGASFAPFRGWSIGYGNPRLTPWAMLFRPPGLVLWLRLCRSVGRPILAAAGFSRLFRPWHANLQFSSLNGLLHFAASDHRPIARPC